MRNIRRIVPPLLGIGIAVPLLSLGLVYGYTFFFGGADLDDSPCGQPTPERALAPTESEPLSSAAAHGATEMNPLLLPARLELVDQTSVRVLYCNDDGDGWLEITVKRTQERSAPHGVLTGSGESGLMWGQDGTEPLHLEKEFGDDYTKVVVRSRSVAPEDLLAISRTIPIVTNDS